MKMRAMAALLVVAVAAMAYQVKNAHTAETAKPLTGYVPPNALLTIESPDFASLLHRWSSSTESEAWLASENYSVFQNSRLFGRLGDAQTSFATAAGVPSGVDLLRQVAGEQSVFAWYDIGKLEFLYITRMTAEQASQNDLFRERGKFQRRHAGNTDFYIRTSGTDYSTIAFASVSTPSGNLLVLATREDLIANALNLISGGAGISAIDQDSWFHDASAALPAGNPFPALHMTMNLERIAKDPHFRSYWVQQNITWIGHYRAAVSDLYLEPQRFREERVLLPKAADADPANSTSAEILAALPPSSTGVFRAVATTDTTAAVTAISEELLGSYSPPAFDPKNAPDPGTGRQTSGSADDLETRIDDSPPSPPSASGETLKRTLQGAGMDGLLTLSSAGVSRMPDDPWVPLHAAVVLHTVRMPDAEAFASGLQQLLRGSLTTSNLGIEFHPSDEGGVNVYSLNGARSLVFATSSTARLGSFIFIADTRSHLLELVQRVTDTPASVSSAPATIIAQFNHATQRAPFIRLASVIDGTNHTPPVSAGSKAPDQNGKDQPGGEPAFFSANARSLSDTFVDLETERVVERRSDGNLRQTVTYNWRGR